MINLSFHHLGVACEDLDKEARAYAQLGYEQLLPDFEDETQGVRGRFMSGPGPCVELLVDLDGSTTVKPWLDRGVKIYHQAFETPHLNDAITYFTSQRARVSVPPVSAVAFDGRPIAFLLLPNMQLIELIQGFS